MRRFVHCIFILTLLLCFASISGFADNPSFEFLLTVDGMEQREVQKGDVITVTLTLRRTDSTTPYKMTAMQDEIAYDGSFFQYVENSAVLKDGITGKDIGLVDGSRRFYMNFLSLSGGSTWEPETRIGSFQLRVISEQGVSRITSQNHLVPLKNTQSASQSTANHLTLVRTTECTVRFQTRGGSPLPDTVVQYGELLPRPDNPVREGYHLTGWYQDIDLTAPWDFEQDKVEQNMTLYAQWAPGNPAQEKAENSNIVLSLILCAAVILLILFLVLKKKRSAQ